MANLVKGTSLRELLYGQVVTKKAQVPPNSGSSATLFTVSGGAVIVNLLVGRVSTALNGTTGAIALGMKPTVGTEETAGIATAGVVGGAEIGTILALSATSGGLAAALIVSGKLAGNAAFTGLGSEFIANTGTIEVTTSVATMTGAIDWYLTYVPLDDGAAVA
jgi:hypothetical protein